MIIASIRSLRSLPIESRATRGAAAFSLATLASHRPAFAKTVYRNEHASAGAKPGDRLTEVAPGSPVNGSAYLHHPLDPDILLHRGIAADLEPISEGIVESGMNDKAR